MKMIERLLTFLISKVDLRHPRPIPRIATSHDRNVEIPVTVNAEIR